MDYADDPYTDGKEYQAEYFKACGDGTNEWRVCSRGKRIIINGEEFFTEDDDRDKDEYVRLTHARTGALAGSIEWVRSHWEETLERAAKRPDVLTLPFKEDDEDADK